MQIEVGLNDVAIFLSEDPDVFYRVFIREDGMLVATRERREGDCQFTDPLPLLDVGFDASQTEVRTFSGTYEAYCLVAKHADPPLKAIS